MNKHLRIHTSYISTKQPNLDDEVEEIPDDQISPINKFKMTKMALDSSSTITTLNFCNVSTANDSNEPNTITNNQIISPANKGTTLKRRRAPAKRSSMTDIDLLNRNNMINDIVESTRKLVAFTIKHLDKDKPIQHFKNDKFVDDVKEHEFEIYYDLLENLGEGCSSVVKLCRRKSTGVLFAVKIFRAFDDEYIHFAKNEFNNLKTIDSEHVVKVYEMFYDQNKCKIYTVMEYCKGITLHKLVSEVGPLPGI